MTPNRIHSSCASLFLALATASTASAAVPAYRNAILADGAVAYYEFDETAGTVAADTALTLGGANNGNILAGVSLNQASAYANLGTAFGFNGATYVRIPDNPIFDLGTGAFTIELWYRTAVDGRGDLFTYKGGGGDFGIHSNSEGDPAGFDAGVSVYFTNGFSAPAAGANLNAWHHVAVTRGNAGAMSIYIDGNLRSTGTDNDTLNIANDLLIGSNFGANIDTPALSFNGQIDEVAIYPSALSNSQINNHIALAVPEPGSCSLLAMGVFGLAFRRRSARK